MAARGQNQGNGKISTLSSQKALDSPLHPRGKIPQRTQSVMSVPLELVVQGTKANRKTGSRGLLAASGSLEDLEIIQEEDTHPSIDTSLNHEEDDQEIDETSNIRAIKILIAIAVYYDYEIWQIDVKTAFLNRYLNESVYMEQPEGFVNPKYPKRVCKLKRSIYGLKQASSALIGRVQAKHFATSSAEAEYIAAFDASKEAVWVRKFIYGLGVVPTIEKPINMYCDNTGAIAIANESGITKGARHFRAKVHYLREVIEFGDIKLEKVHTYDNLADPFTKALAFPKHSKLTRNIGMLPASSLM
ncbi:retrovirus-related pol polyprotein from transposon TNT 1-94 [Tanacetum coccineum]